MQRVPTRQRQTVPQNYANRQQQGADASPALLMARRVREEQGVEQLKAFLAAMEPFVAPNELKTICGGFGLSYDVVSGMNRRKQGQPQNEYGQNPSNSNRNPGGMGQFQLMQMLMNMQGGGKGKGMDVSQLFKMFGGS